MQGGRLDRHDAVPPRHALLSRDERKGASSIYSKYQCGESSVQACMDHHPTTELSTENNSKLSYCTWCKYQCVFATFPSTPTLLVRSLPERN
jgi:hypothetical protein